MHIPQCKIDISGKQPKLEIIWALEKMIEALLCRSPSDSSLTLRLFCGKHHVSGVLSIKSFSGSFISGRSDLDVLSVIDLMKEDIQGQLRNWVASRKFCH